MDNTGHTVRNLYTNPGNETASAAATMRTNLCPQPSFETASGTVTVRTNFNTNPRGVNVFTDYNGPTQQTITANVSISGAGAPANPDGILTANRVAYTVSGGNPGIMVYGTQTVGTLYSMSAWVYHESINGGTQGFAEKGVSSQPTPPAIVQGSWTKVSWLAYTATATAGFGFRVTGQTGSGSFLITGIQVEATKTLGSFFDGASTAAGDFTYSWSSTANASTSLQKASSLTGWLSATQGIPYQTGTFHDGTKAAAVTMSGFGSGGDGLYASDIAVTAGTVYTGSAWIQVPSGFPNMSYVFRWKDSGGTTLSDGGGLINAQLVAGQWARVSMTATAPTNAAKLQWMVRSYDTSYTPYTFYIDSVLIEASTVLGTYFDGSTAAGNDFTYAWTGTANASTSIQKYTPVSLASQQNCYVAQSTDWNANGTYSARVIPSSPSTDSAYNLGISLQNKTYTLMATCRVKTAQTGSPDTLRARRIQLYYTGVGPGNSAQAPNVPGVYPLSVTFTVTDYTQYQSFRLYNGASAGNGDIWWDNIMLVEGAYSGDYIDGTKPYAKWDGTANASTSVGYPAQLTDLAGRPDKDIVGAGTLAATTVSDPYMPRTIYAVWGNVGTADNYAVPFRYGIVGSNGLGFQGSATGGSVYGLRMDMPSGQFNGTINMVNGRLLRVNVCAFTINQGLTSAAAFLNGAADVTFAPTPGNGWSSDLFTAAATADVTPIRFLCYNANHDRNTRVAISRYLGNKYGAYVA